MRMDKNVRIDTIEKIIATASDIVKTVKLARFINMGIPVWSSLPPGAVKAAENATVAIKKAGLEKSAVVEAAARNLRQIPSDDDGERWCFSAVYSARRWYVAELLLYYLVVPTVVSMASEVELFLPQLRGAHGGSVVAALLSFET
nr:hypothetical protein CRG98_027575 [Ipomoea batatas]